ncbi:glycosyltransferase involved in cell wall biosynthesis [Paenibacillus endophyticus]|uniref:Glycosyltransferase involved in cell wall biosynthesis n=1 Tax=Paenibacillus endophyticus TaxID=1294268 RepID=A0A7W5C8F6_9BACL|nr:glycosyltransferase family 4 protein [Paenibacillus endophyticus]MBB3152640.1 glycosyltransferase involved in cell wall biosynthesis [Paenibacillus endophyticus]
MTNEPKRDTVTILTHSYLDGYTQNITRPFGGGLERYIHSLCRVIMKMGLQPIVYQLSYYGTFNTVYEGVQVRGWTYETDKIAAAFEEMAEASEGILIYGSCIWHPIRYRPGSIGICHGISWDRHDMPRDTKQEVAAIIHEAVLQLDLVVSVDSQFLTYCRSVCCYPDPTRVILLPNAVDTEWFTPMEEAGGDEGDGLASKGESNEGTESVVSNERIEGNRGMESNERIEGNRGMESNERIVGSRGIESNERIEGNRGIESNERTEGSRGIKSKERIEGDGARSTQLRVLFPRRLSFERGIVPMMLVATSLLQEYPGVTVEFAGELVEKTPVAIAFRLWLDSHPHRDRIEHRVYSFDEVRMAYRNADIAVIPTIFSEGTSLACLEAMSCGIPVVSSNVGGLNDIVIDGLNGRLVPPQAETLTAAVKTLMDDDALRRSMGKLARLTALAFDQRKWHAQWSAIIEAQREKLQRD